MEDIKLFRRSCPKCGETYRVCELAKVNLGGKVQYNMQCENNHKWSEFYSLDYQGYWWDGKLYNNYGEEILKEET